MAGRIVLMVLHEGVKRPQRGTCAHCEVADQRISRLVIVGPDKASRIIMVCSFCYLRLKPRRVSPS